MPTAILDTPCLHRQDDRPRICEGCGRAYLTSRIYNPTERCWQCGGWSKVELAEGDPFEALRQAECDNDRRLAFAAMVAAMGEPA